MTRATFLLLVAVFLLGCNGGAVPPTPTKGAPAAGTPGDGDEAVTVTVRNIAFQTETVMIEPGAEVRWVNEDTVAHTVTHGQQGTPVDDPVIDEPHPPGETVSFVFEEPGDYPITCTIHPQMNMTVEVE